MTHTDHIQKTKAFLMLSFIILFITDSLLHIKLGTTLLAVIIMILFVISFPKVKRFNKYVSSILMISGMYLLIKSSVSLDAWEGALTKNAGLTVLLLAVPMLSIIFYLVDFSSYISSFAGKYVKSNFSFFIFTSLIINFFGLVLNVASFPMVHKLLENISGKYPKKIFYSALTRSYCLGQLWAPNFLAMAIALEYSGLQWHSYALFGILFAVIGAILSVIVGRITVKGYRGEALSQNVEGEDKIAEVDFKGLPKAIGIAASLIISIVSIQYLSGKSILVVVPFVSLVFPVLLALLLREVDTYTENFKVYFNSKLPRMNNEIILFTSIGFFGQALSTSGADKYIPLIIKSAGFSSPAILIPFIIILIIALSMVGFHPILTVSAIAIAYSAGAIPLSQLQLAAVFSISYFSYTLLSPFSGMILAVASLVRENPMDLGIKINLIFSLVFISICSFIIVML